MRAPPIQRPHAGLQSPVRPATTAAATEPPSSLATQNRQCHQPTAIFTKVTFQATVNAGNPAVGRDFAFRFIGSTSSAIVDNVVVRTVSPFAGDQVPPAIASLTPADDSTQVSVVDNLVIVFDENIAVNAGYITLKNLTTTAETVINVIDGTKVLITGDTLQINPSADLDTNTFYAVRIDPGAIVDLAGNGFPGISDDITWTFNTGEVDDSVAPSVVSVSPADGTTGVSYSTSLSMTFDENVVANTGNITLRNLTDSTQTVIDIADSSQVSVSGTAVTITPSSYLGEGKDYAVRMDAAAILDLAGNPYAGISDDLTWNFTTSANNPPAIVAFNPADEAVGVDPGASLSVTFDENIMVGAGNITLRNLSTIQRYGDCRDRHLAGFGEWFRAHDQPGCQPAGRQGVRGADASVARCWTLPAMPLAESTARPPGTSRPASARRARSLSMTSRWRAAHRT